MHGLLVEIIDEHIKLAIVLTKCHLESRRVRLEIAVLVLTELDTGCVERLDNIAREILLEPGTRVAYGVVNHPIIQSVESLVDAHHLGTLSVIIATKGQIHTVLHWASLVKHGGVLHAIGARQGADLKTKLVAAVVDVGGLGTIVTDLDCRDGKAGGGKRLNRNRYTTHFTTRFGQERVNQFLAGTARPKIFWSAREKQFLAGTARPPAAEKLFAATLAEWL